MNLYHPYPGVVEGAPASRDYIGGFQTGLIRKDLALAIDSAKDAGSSVKIAEAVE
jgi:3-hydroxyisobutyrate dehydrogenase